MILASENDIMRDKSRGCSQMARNSPRSRTINKEIANQYETTEVHILNHFGAQTHIRQGFRRTFGHLQLVLWPGSLIILLCHEPTETPIRTRLVSFSTFGNTSCCERRDRLRTPTYSVGLWSKANDPGHVTLTARKLKKTLKRSYLCLRHTHNVHSCIKAPRKFTNVPENS